MRLRSGLRTAGVTVVNVLVSLALVACASFPGRQLPQYPYDMAVLSIRGPAVDYEAKFFVLGNENAAGVSVIQGAIDRVQGRTQFFNTVSPGIGSQPYHLVFELRNEGNTGLAFVSGFITGFTFFLVPGYAKDEYVLRVDVVKDGQSLKQYEYRDHMKTWFHLFMIVLTPTHFPKAVSEKVIDNMVLNFVHDVQRDNVFAQSETNDAAVGFAERPGTLFRN